MTLLIVAVMVMVVAEKELRWANLSGTDDLTTPDTRTSAGLPSFATPAVMEKGSVSASTHKMSSSRTWLHTALYSEPLESQTRHTKPGFVEDGQRSLVLPDLRTTHTWQQCFGRPPLPVIGSTMSSLRLSWLSLNESRT